jgi:N utilization substance protein A
MTGELLRIVDSIHRDKEIDKEVILEGIETALKKAAKKKFDLEDEDELEVRIDRETGAITARSGDEEIDPILLGRIAAQAAKQVIIQKIKEAEQDVIFGDYEHRVGEIVHGHVARIEGRNVILNIQKAEAILPKKEQVPEERWKVGDRLRSIIVEVKKTGQKVKIILSRSHPDLVLRLFELEVPEIAESIIEIQALVREAGYRTKVAVSSNDAKVDPVGACVGVRGSRIKSIIDELNGEKIDIIRWSDNSETLLQNALKPSKVDRIIMDDPMRKATVVVSEDQLSLAIGKKGQNVRLASRLAEWEIDILTEEEVAERGERAMAEFLCVPDMTEDDAACLRDFGYYTLEDIYVRGPELLSHVEGFDDERAAAIIDFISRVDLDALAEEIDRNFAPEEEEIPPEEATDAAEGAEEGTEESAAEAAAEGAGDETPAPESDQTVPADAAAPVGESGDSAGEETEEPLES